MAGELQGKKVAFLATDAVRLVRSFFDAGKPVAATATAPGRWSRPAWSGAAR